jgi:hypothetical protein
MLVIAPPALSPPFGAPLALLPPAPPLCPPEAPPLAFTAPPAPLCTPEPPLLAVLPPLPACGDPLPPVEFPPSVMSELQAASPTVVDAPVTTST